MRPNVVGSEEPLVGRESEQARLVEFIDADADPRGMRAIVLAGEVGIGKSALWRFAVERSRAAGHAVLTSSPTRDDLVVVAGVLTELFEPVGCDPRVTDTDTDPFERARSVLTGLRSLVSTSPVLIAIDGLRHVDDVSAKALRYALRRLEGTPLKVLATAEENRATTSVRSAVERALGIADVEHITVGPMNPAELRSTLSRSVGTISRPALHAVHSRTGGNPMFALRLVEGATSPRARSPTDVFTEQLAAAPPDVVPLLQLIAISGPIHVDPARALLDHADLDAVLERAVAHGIVCVDEDLIIRFAHPLMATPALELVSARDQRELHRRLADRVENPAARALHLARSATSPDVPIADELEKVARRSARQGASELAAELAAHARRLTPMSDMDASGRRALLEASNRAAAGEPVRAVELLDRLLAETSSTTIRIEAVTQRAFLDFDHSEEFVGAALEEASDELVRGRALDLLGWQAGTYRGQLERGLELSGEALTIGRGLGDAELTMLAATALATTSLFAGSPRSELMEEALAIAERMDHPRLGRWPEVFWARHCLWAGRLDDARSEFERARTFSASAGSEFQRPYRLFDCAMSELAAGNPRLAATFAADGIEAAQDAGNAHAVAWLQQPLGLAQVWLGDHQLARRAADALREWANVHDEPPRAVAGLRILGLVGLATDDAPSALHHLVGAVDILDGLGFVHPGVTGVLFDAVDAALSSGDAVACRSLSVALREQADRLRVPLVDAMAIAGEGCALIGRDDASACDHLVRASARFEALGYTCDAARARLMLARAMAALGDPTAAAEAAGSAAAAFDGMGAASWARLAASRHAPPRSATGARALTETDEKVIDLVAEGLRNREIASALFMSLSSVEAHLTRIYRLLGVRSRTGLLRKIRDEGVIDE